MSGFIFCLFLSFISLTTPGIVADLSPKISSSGDTNDTQNKEWEMREQSYQFLIDPSLSLENSDKIMTNISNLQGYDFQDVLKNLPGESKLWKNPKAIERIIEGFIKTEIRIPERNQILIALRTAVFAPQSVKKNFLAKLAQISIPITISDLKKDFDFSQEELENYFPKIEESKIQEALEDLQSLSNTLNHPLLILSQIEKAEDIDVLKAQEIQEDGAVPGIEQQIKGKGLPDKKACLLKTFQEKDSEKFYVKITIGEDSLTFLQNRSGYSNAKLFLEKNFPKDWQSLIRPLKLKISKIRAQKKLTEAVENGGLPHVKPIFFSSKPSVSGAGVAQIEESHVRELLEKLEILSPDALKNAVIENKGDIGGSSTLSLYSVSIDKKIRFFVKGTTLQDLYWLHRFENSEMMLDFRRLSDPKMPKLALDQQLIAFEAQNGREYYLSVINAATDSVPLRTLFRDPSLHHLIGKGCQAAGTAIATIHLRYALNSRDSLEKIKTVAHGDFHFNNVFVDPETLKVTLIDNATFASPDSRVGYKENCTDLRDYHKLPRCSPRGDLIYFSAFLESSGVDASNRKKCLKAFEKGYKNIFKGEGLDVPQINLVGNKDAENLNLTWLCSDNYGARGKGTLLCQKWECQTPNNKTPICLKFWRNYCMAPWAKNSKECLTNYKKPAWK